EQARLDLGARGMSGQRPILIPLDGSELAEKALPYAAALAQERRVPLLLVRVVEVHGVVRANLSTAAMTDLIVEEDWKEAEQYLSGRVQALRGIAPGLVVRPALPIGDPAVEILAAERACGAQAVVLTTHGRAGLKRWLRGSVAEQVLRYGQAPVLLVRPWDTR